MNHAINTPVRVRNVPTVPVALRGETGVVIGHLSPWKCSVAVQFADGTREALQPQDLETI